MFGTAYHCLVCRLWDHADKGQFHCEGCGICRYHLTLAEQPIPVV